MIRRFPLLLSLMLVAGCSYSFYPPKVATDIKSINILIFENKTFEHGLDTSLIDALEDEFIFDGTLKVTKSHLADSQLEGEITDYIIEPLTYDYEDSVEERRVRIKVNLIYRDLRNNETIW